MTKGICIEVQAKKNVGENLARNNFSSCRCIVGSIIGKYNHPKLLTAGTATVDCKRPNKFSFPRLSLNNLFPERKTVANFYMVVIYLRSGVLFQCVGSIRQHFSTSVFKYAILLMHLFRNTKNDFH